MSKLDPLVTISSGFNSTAEINNNFTKIADALDNTLSRDGCTPNFMDAVLDMNSNRVINTADPINNGDVVTLGFFNANAPADSVQNLWETMTADVGGNLVASSITDTLNFVGGTNVTVTSTGGDTLTFDVPSSTVNSFETIRISGQNDVVADSGTDILTLIAGTGITLTTNDTTDTVTITGSASFPVGGTAFTSEVFTDGGGYTAGVNNSITLVATPFAKESLLIFYTGVNQHVPQFSLSGNVVTFTSIIPVGVTEIQVYILSDPVYGEFSAIPDITIVAAGAIGPTAHGLTAAPTGYELSLVNQNAEFGYSPGEVIPIDLNQSSNRGVTIKLAATNLTGRFGSDANTFEILNFTTGATASLTNANWKLRIKLIG